MRKRVLSFLSCILFLGVIWGIAYTTPIALPKTEYFYGSYLPCSEYKKPLSEEETYLSLITKLDTTLLTDNYLFTYRHNTDGYAFTLNYGVCTDNYLLRFLTNNQRLTLFTDITSTTFYAEDLTTKNNLVAYSSETAKDFVNTFFDSDSLVHLFENYTFDNLEYMGVNYTNGHACLRINAEGIPNNVTENNTQSKKLEFESNLDSELTPENLTIDNTYTKFEFYFDKTTLNLYSIVLHNDSDTITILIEPCDKSTLLEYKTPLNVDELPIDETVEPLEVSNIERLLLYSLYSDLEKHTVEEEVTEESNEKQIKTN